MGLFKLFGDNTPSPEPRIHPLTTELEELESRADEICRALAIDLRSIEARASDASPIPADVLEPLSRGNKIEAIRVYRELMKCDLKAAKDAVDAMDAGVILESASPFRRLQFKLDAIAAKVREQR